MALNDQLLSALSQWGQSMQLPQMSQDQNMMFDLYANRPDFAANYYPALQNQQRIDIGQRQENRLQGQQDALSQLAQRLGQGGFDTKSALAQLAVAQGDPTALINYQIQQDELAKKQAQQNIISSVLGGGFNVNPAPTGINPAAQKELDANWNNQNQQSLNPYAGNGNPAINNPDYSQIKPLISLSDTPVEPTNRTLPPAMPQIPQNAPQPQQLPAALQQLGLMAQLDPATYGDDYLKAKLAYEQEQVKAPIEAQQRQAASDKNLTEGESAIRKEFEGLPDVKEFRNQERGYQSILAGAKDLTGAGGIATIFSFMKSLDPSSTVREGEYATAQNAGGVPAWVMNKYNQALSGNGLTKEMRDEFVNQATMQYKASEDLFNQRVNQYKDVAKQYGFNPDRTIQGARLKVETPESPIIKNLKARGYSEQDIADYKKLRGLQ